MQRVDNQRKPPEEPPRRGVSLLWADPQHETDPSALLWSDQLRRQWRQIRGTAGAHGATIVASLVLSGDEQITLDLIDRIWRMAKSHDADQVLTVVGFLGSDERCDEFRLLAIPRLADEDIEVVEAPTEKL